MIGFYNLGISIFRIGFLGVHSTITKTRNPQNSVVLITEGHKLPSNYE